MALKDCLTKLLDEKLITRAQADSISKEADRLKETYRGEGRADDIAAEKDALEGMIKRNKYERYQASLAVTKQVEARNIMNNFKGSKVQGLRSMLRFDVAGLGKGTLDIQSSSRAIYGAATSKLADFIEQYRSKVPGGFDINVRSRVEDLEAIARARHGDVNVKPELKQIADLYGEITDGMLDRLRRAGVPTNKLDNWGLPHRWSGDALQKAGKQTFVDDILIRLDKNRMIDKSTGNRLTEQEIRNIVEEAYDTIITDGLSKIVKLGGARVRRGPFMQSKHSAARVLHFKDGNAWLDLHRKYGEGDIFETMLRNVETNATDIAIAERFGPNPDKTFRALDAEALIEERTVLKRPQAVSSNEKVWNLITGRTEGIANPKLAETMATLRNIQTSAKLGQAVLAAAADQGFLLKQANFLGLSYGKMFKGILSDLAGLQGKERRKLGLKLGLSADWATGIFSTASRFTEMDALGSASKVTAQLADFTLRASGLGKITQVGKFAFGMEFNMHLADAIKAGKGIDDLDEGLKISLREVHGFTDRTWDKLKEGLDEIKGQPIIDIEKLDQDTQTRLLSMIHAETRLAVPEPDVAFRALATQGQAAGSIGGELSKTALQFKSFPLTVVLDNVRRFMYHPAYATARNKYSDAAKLVLASTMIGAIVTQAKNLTGGKDVMDPSDPELWVRATLQGGALGYFGDVFLSPAISSKDIVSSFAGPVAQMTADALFMVGNTINKAATGQKDKIDIGKKGAEFIKGNFPAGNIFYTKLAMERLIFDQLRFMADPEAATSWKRSESRMRRRTGQEFFWKPGHLKPSRAPKIAKDPK